MTKVSTVVAMATKDKDEISQDSQVRFIFSSFNRKKYDSMVAQKTLLLQASILYISLLFLPYKKCYSLCQSTA